MKSRKDFFTDSEYREYLRIYFAGLAMQGLLACSEIECLSDDICESAVGLADELLKQLEL
jgi:hypothetical protein